MKKTIIFLILFLILPFTQALSLYSAQDIAKEYMLSTEYLDSSVYYVTCDNNEYYVLNIVDSKAIIVLFLPIESNTGEVIFKKNTDSQKILKTSLLYRNIKTKDNGKNFLSQQLIDKIENLNISLQSKSARLDGIIKSNYSSAITEKCQSAKEKLDSLISKLQELKTKLDALQKEQAVFLEKPDCSKTDDLIYSYKTSFSGYNDLIASGINYRDATNEIVEVVIADQKLDDTTKKIIMNYTEAPNTISTDISTIVDSVSSTNQFYLQVISDFERVGPNSPLEILQETLGSRQDYFIAKSLLHNYDSELKGTLDNSINHILSSQNINLWKDTKTVSELSQNYAQIKELYNKGRYQESINKIKLAKNQVKKINSAGIIEIETQDVSNYLIYFIIAIILILGTIILIKKIKIKKHKKPRKQNKEIDPEFLLNRRDPFR